MDKLENMFVTAHLDNNYSQMSGLRLDRQFKMTDNCTHLKGTLDNLVGCMALSRFWAYLDDHNIAWWYTQNEEAGQSIDYQSSKRLSEFYSPQKDLAINIDVDEIADTKVICQLDNITGFSVPEIEELKEFILYCFNPRYKYKILTNYYEITKSDADFEDDSWSFAKKDFYCLTITIPIRGNFHSNSAEISQKTFTNYCICLEAVLKYFVNLIENNRYDKQKIEIPSMGHSQF